MNVIVFLKECLLIFYYLCWSKLIEFFGYEVEYIWIIWLVENVCVYNISNYYIGLGWFMCLKN